jgi:hypothetical protein
MADFRRFSPNPADVRHFDREHPESVETSSHRIKNPRSVSNPPVSA